MLRYLFIQYSLKIKQIILIWFNKPLLCSILITIDLHVWIKKFTISLIFYNNFFFFWWNHFWLCICYIGTTIFIIEIYWKNSLIQIYCMIFHHHPPLFVSESEYLILFFSFIIILTIRLYCSRLSSKMTDWLIVQTVHIHGKFIKKKMINSNLKSELDWFEFSFSLLFVCFFDCFYITSWFVYC